MGRIVNFKRFIAKYPFENEFGTMFIKIEDDVLQSNNGVWKVSKAGIEQEFQEDHWQIRGKINDLSAFFFGQLSLEQAVQLHRIQVQAINDEQLAQFDSAVKKNILGFNDYF
ncbi:sterol carrier protein domain-containing protein [Ligilactobacillus aviarius]